MVCELQRAQRVPDSKVSVCRLAQALSAALVYKQGPHKLQRLPLHEQHSTESDAHTTRSLIQEVSQNSMFEHSHSM